MINEKVIKTIVVLLCIVGSALIGCIIAHLANFIDKKTKHETEVDKLRERKPFRKKYRFENGARVLDTLTGKSGTIIGGYGELFPRQYAVLYDKRAEDGSMEGRTLKPKYLKRWCSIIRTEADDDT